MDFDYNQFNMFKRKIDYWKISSLLSAAVGGILLFVSIFLKFPAFIYTASIGGVLLLYFLGYKIYIKNKDRIKTIRPRTAKIGKVQKVTKIKNDKERVLSVCPSCGQKIRLPNKKGKHGVNCPKCHHHFEVKI